MRGKMEHLTNEFNPANQEKEGRDMSWIKQHHLGRPQATPYHTVKQLEELNYVGVYKRPESDEGRLK